MTRILLIDNYDSFTWNLVHLVGALGVTVDVVRNDAIGVDGVLNCGADAIILSPGPCTPTEAGICLDVVRDVGPAIPIFGVCLGLQAIGQAFGGEVRRGPRPMHGKVSQVRHNGRGLFHGVNGSFAATRYHSLIVERSTCPPDFEISAETEDGLIMAMSHRHLPVHGVQFHPESVMSEHGTTIVSNFLRLAQDWNRAQGRSLRETGSGTAR